MGEPAAWLVKLIDASRWPVCSDSQEPSGGQHARGAWLWSASWRMCVMSLHGLLGIISPSYGDEMTNLHTPSNTCCPGIVDGLGWKPRPP